MTKIDKLAIALAALLFFPALAIGPAGFSFGAIFVVMFWTVARLVAWAIY